MMRKTLFLLVALVAAPTLVLSKMENAVVPEAPTTMESKDSTSHEDTTFLLSSAGSKPIDAAKLIVEKMKVNPGSLTSLNQAIDTIIGEITAKTTVDQRLVDGEITAFGTASALPVRDTALDTAQTATCALVAPARTALTATQTRSYQLDFGATADTAQLAANNAKGEVDTDLLAFGEELRDLNAKTLACSGATAAATAAAGDLVTAKDRAYCQAKVSYDSVVTDVTTNSATQITNIKHFKMLKCVMTEYAADTKEQAALDKCSAQTYDVDVATVDLKASQAVVPASTVCVTTAPTAPPTEPPTGPPAEFLNNNNFYIRSWEDKRKFQTSDTLTFTTGGGFPMTTTGWNHMRWYGRGLVTDARGHPATGTVSGLTPNTLYDMKAYSWACDHNPNSFSYRCDPAAKFLVNGQDESTGLAMVNTCRAQADSFILVKATSDAAGEITWTINHPTHCNSYLSYLSLAAAAPESPTESPTEAPAATATTIQEGAYCTHHWPHGGTLPGSSAFSIEDCGAAVKAMTGQNGCTGDIFIWGPAPHQRCECATDSCVARVPYFGMIGDTLMHSIYQVPN